MTNGKLLNHLNYAHAHIKIHSKQQIIINVTCIIYYTQYKYINMHIQIYAYIILSMLVYIMCITDII